ncbi:hypothetical protein [Mycobacterium kansasii]|uniref:hypothetical protein n=1 Tax=Mycobacterium kansasii TaxID=1768 RepID=UPI0004D3F0BB|nr:hypothetical protein [Mycobacterium kansasii]KEP42268.1 hypothetical protein MKSMC1_25600 [Mycobacterium kansasii]
MGNIKSISKARKLVREAQSKANEARIERERLNVEDAASLLVELGRVAAVDEWEHNRISEVRAEAERRRHEHRVAGAQAVARMQQRGETISGIAELAAVKVGEVRAALKAAGSRRASRAGSVHGTQVARAMSSGDGAGSNGAASQALGGRGGAAGGGAATPTPSTGALQPSPNVGHVS